MKEDTLDRNALRGEMSKRKGMTHGKNVLHSSINHLPERVLAQGLVAGS